MPALDFPANPQVGDVFDSGSGRRWSWNGTTWVIDSGSSLVAQTIDAKGDLLVGLASDSLGRLVVGANNTILTADSAQTPGVKWTSSIVGTSMDQLRETWNLSATAATGTINLNVRTSSIWHYTSNATANFTLNIRGDASTTLSSLLSVGESITVVFANTNGATPYRPTVFQIDGSTVTPKWQAGVAPAAGNASAVDFYSITIVKTAANPIYDVYASQTQFK